MCWRRSFNRAERELAPGRAVVDATGHRSPAAGMDELDERFLNHMQAQVPSVVSTLGPYCSASEERVLPLRLSSRFSEEIDVLFRRLKKVPAENISVFLQGL